MGSICFQVMVTLYKISLGGQATNIAPPSLWTLDVIFLLLYLRDQGLPPLFSSSLQDGLSTQS